MATSAQHAAWIRRGKPWRLARPLLRLRDRLRAYGYTVYDLGNTDHLDHIPPERHCPYSETNWPAYQGRPMPDVVTAIDVMPPPSGSGLPSLQALGARLFADKQAGHPGAVWLVGMNWGPTSNRTAVRDTWRPGHVRGSSGDVGHIHVDCRSDAIDSAAGDDYDPVARLRGQKGTDMSQQAENILSAWAGGMPTYTDNAGKVQQLVPVAEIWRMIEFRKGVVNALTAIAEKVDLDPAELDLVRAAAREGALSAADGLAAAVVAALPEGERLSRADVEAAIRSVLGGLDGATPSTGPTA